MDSRRTDANRLGIACHSLRPDMNIVLSGTEIRARAVAQGDVI